jgi:hypothetical protein
MTDSLERFLHDLRFDVPAGLVDRAKTAAVVQPDAAHPAAEFGQTTQILNATRSHRVDGDRSMGRRTELVAGIAAVVLALIVIGSFVYIRVVASPQPAVPVAPEPTIKQYQARIAADQAATLNFLQYQCTINPPESTACADGAAVAIDALQTWLDDLNQTRPPGRFAAIDGRIRHHLAAGIADLHVVIAANQAMDVSGAAAAVTASMNERDTLNREASAVIFSSQETVQAYSAIVRSDDSNLLACDLCQKLVNQNLVSCPVGQTPTCADEIDATRLQVETFQDDTVRGFGPSSLAAKDEHLQADLLAADTAVNSMSSALSAGNQLQLGAGRNTLRQALSLVDRDATDIARGG